MFKKSMVFLFCLTSTIANAQDIPAVEVKKSVFCADAKSVFKNITESEWEETPVWVGNGADSTFTLIANEKTGTWTLIQFNQEIACIIDVGVDHSLLNAEKGI